MQLYIYIALGIFSATILLLCLEILVCIKNGFIEKEIRRFGSVLFIFKIGCLILFVVGILLTGINSKPSVDEFYFSESFPLVIRGESNYLKDMKFVETKESKLFEAIGYSDSEQLLISLSKGDLEVQYYPNTPRSWFDGMLSYDGETLDTFLPLWESGTMKNWPPVD